MSFQRQGAPSLDYRPVSYPGSVLRFRGPGSDIAAPHLLCLGGTETFGRFIAEPYPALLAARLDGPVVNMGVAGSGIDVVLEDRAIQAAATAASAIVLQVPGAQSLSNRLYAVHPRRNDRFVKASGILRTIYRDVDFTEFHFTRHMLDHLKALSPERFEIVRDEVQAAWTMRMLRFLEKAPAPVHLLWLARRGPDEAEPEHGLGEEPLFVTRAMLDKVAGAAASLSIVEGGRDAAGSATPGMVFAPGEAAAARLLPGPRAHETARDMLLAQVSGRKTNGPRGVSGGPSSRVGPGADQSLEVNSGTASKRSATRP